MASPSLTTASHNNGQPNAVLPTLHSPVYIPPTQSRSRGSVGSSARGGSLDARRPTGRLDRDGVWRPIGDSEESRSRRPTAVLSPPRRTLSPPPRSPYDSLDLFLAHERELQSPIPPSLAAVVRAQHRHAAVNFLVTCMGSCHPCDGSPSQAMTSSTRPSVRSVSAALSPSRRLFTVFLTLPHLPLRHPQLAFTVSVVPFSLTTAPSAVSTFFPTEIYFRLPGKKTVIPVTSTSTLPILLLRG
ncbi:unnamed protein product [Schistocephalus solidus]|uniref:Uncharacterized protein n=1 Tax=Schistocephalus solidus TaxID=70667 RepID=A0A3P7CL74_SCHSO|nr:unnamed protein product [Schistocephalus solidus]